METAKICPLLPEIFESCFQVTVLILSKQQRTLADNDRRIRPSLLLLCSAAVAAGLFCFSQADTVLEGGL